MEIVGVTHTDGALPSTAFWRGRRVLLTGHTGFKGGWLALWLEALGARVTAFALPAEAGPSFHDLAGVAAACDGRTVDLRDAEAVRRIVREAEPEIVLHLAAEAIVRRAAAAPAATFATNVLGTAHLLEALRDAAGLTAALVVTSDKVYANDGAGRAFDEDAPLGGHDPYSASKAACELLVASFRDTYFAPRGVPLATARGGNVVGGGDFGAYRLGPDCVRAALAGAPVILRNPDATRPWQHVFDCLNGYLLHAEALASRADAPRALNFGPAPEGSAPVRLFAERLLTAMGAPVEIVVRPAPDVPEAPRLALDATRARATLGWSDRLTGEAAIAATASWVRRWRDGLDMAAQSRADIAAYTRGEPIE